MPDTATICEACRKPVDPTLADVVYAVRLLHPGRFGNETTESVEGPGRFFHLEHFPRSSPDYRLTERPEGL